MWVRKMQRVIYADVLVVINIYITYFLLKSTALLAKEAPDRIRLLISALLGGTYSLTVLFQWDEQGFTVALRVVAALVFVFVAFGYKSLKRFVRLNFCFILCSFVFAGIMLALWYFFSPAGMYFNGSVVYFDVNVLTLVLLTIACYVFITVFEKIFKTRAPVNTVFYCTVFHNGKEYRLKAFLDTGNRLKDYFTGKPVVIAERKVFEDMFANELDENRDGFDDKIRYIFCNTVAGGGLLACFSPQKLHVKGVDYDFSTNEVAVALSEKKLFGGEFDAILPMSLFENKLSGKDGRESEKSSATV